MRGLRFILAAAIAALLLVPLACGDDDGATTTAAPATTAPAATESVPPEPAETVEAAGETTPAEAAPAPLPSNRAARKAVLAYRAYLRKQATIMATEATPFAKALRQGTPARAQAIYPRLVTAYESIRPALADLGYDLRLGAAEGEAQGEWTGLHAIEKILFDTGTTAGTEQLGARFVSDVEELRRALPGLELSPAVIIGYGKELADRVPATTMKEEAEQYSRLQLDGVDGDVRGARAAYRAVRPIVNARNPDLAASLDSTTAGSLSVVDSLRAPVQLRSWDELSEGDIQAVLDAVADLQKELAAAQGAV
jgi:iron uptake system component EfeO